MSQTIAPTTPATDTAATSPRATGVKWGLITLVVAVATAIYGAYGDPHPVKSQEQAVPFIAAVVTVAAIAVYGLLLPAGLRGIAARRGAWSGWGLALGIVSVLAVPVAFWSGLPVVLGTAAALLGSAGRRAATTGRLATATVVLGTIGAVGCLGLSVLGNTLASS
jgi:hypothetical protein